MDTSDRIPRADRPAASTPASTHAESRLRCPKDATLMERLRVPASGASGFTIDRCAACGSIWFDANELSKVLTHKHVVPELDTGKLVQRDQMAVALGGLVCPRDKSPLIKTTDVQQRHIEMDSCGVCGGVLLDAGELSDLSVHTLGEKIRRLLNRD